MRRFLFWVLSHLGFTSAVRCRPDRPYGLHGQVVTGVGAMGDGELCLRCGWECYHHLVGESYVPAGRALWPEMEAARRLPHGIDARCQASDPVFDAWFNSPLSDGRRLPFWTQRKEKK